VNVGGVLAALGVPDLHDRLGLVDARITDALSVGNGALAAATLRVAGSGGKRLRPALTVACAHLGDVFDERVVSGAAAVELVQVGSLIHDDIFEEAFTRRGVPTINAVEGSKTALLAGDFVLACAGTEAARAGREQAVVLADTIVALCEGQVAEMRDVGNIDREFSSYVTSITGKTAALFAAACRIGGLCAALPEPMIESLARFGHEFGIAYQILDDVLDVIANPVRLGKAVGIDLCTGVYTLPVLAAAAGDSSGRLRHLLARAEPDDVAAALRIVSTSDGIPIALSHVQHHAERASAAVDGIVGQPTRGLYEFPATYTTWAVEYFTDDSEEQSTA
jgi:geranylgeranyl pyrophosphate synthase